jgi:hypothetical protein
MYSGEYGEAKKVKSIFDRGLHEEINSLKIASLI